MLVFLHNTIYRAQLFYPFLLSASEFLSNLLFSYHLLYFCTALFLIIILSSNHLHKSKTLSQLTQCPFTGTLLLFSTTNIGHQETNSINLNSPQLGSHRRNRWQNANTLTHLMSPYYTERQLNHNLMYTMDHTFGYRRKKFVEIIYACSRY